MKNNCKKSEINKSSYKALKGSIARFRKEAEQQAEAIKREVIGKFRLKFHK